VHTKAVLQDETNAFEAFKDDKILFQIFTIIARYSLLITIYTSYVSIQFFQPPDY
jgi:hypothetical protein